MAIACLTCQAQGDGSDPGREEPIRAIRGEIAAGEQRRPLPAAAEGVEAAAQIEGAAAVGGDRL